MYHFVNEREYGEVCYGFGEGGIAKEDDLFVGEGRF